MNAALIDISSADITVFLFILLKRIRTVANAVSMGTTTGLMLNKELIEEDF